MNHKLLALGLAGLCMVSCSDDDNNSSNNSGVDMSKLTNKKWYAVSDKVNGEVYEYDDHEVCGKDYMEFFTNNTAVTVDVYGCDGNTPLTSELEMPYSVNGKVVSFTLMGIQISGTVKQLNDQTLVAESHYDFDGDNVEDTVISTYTSQP